MKDAPIHTFPDRGAGEWVAYEDYAALKAELDDADSLIKSAFADASSNNIRLAETSHRAKKAEAERDALKSEVERLKAAQAWQPIETAPKDGTKIILFGRCEWNDYGNPSDEPEIAIGYWGAEYVFGTAKEDYEWLTTSSNPYVDKCHATHWMPLPTPPTT